MHLLLRRTCTAPHHRAGEMGGTLLAHPRSYLQAMAQLRAKWDASPAAKAGAVLELGVTFYHAYLPGQINHGPGPVGPVPPSPLSK